MANILIILPNQLFDIKYIDKKTNKIILWEHSQYFKKYKYNKKKIMLHRASMKYYYDYLKKNRYKIDYVEFNKKMDFKFGSKNKYYMFDPIDKIKINKFINIIESPNFLLTKNIYEEYRKKTNKFFFYNFYMWSKKKINIIPNIKSKDKENREIIKNKIKLPPKPKTNTNKYIREAKKYVEKHFKNNYGNTDNFIYPISHKYAKKWLIQFINKKFKQFGKYQDYIDKNNSYLFHSLLSSSINIGLINPIEIINLIKKYKNKIPINSYEGYIRQLFWREYQRYCYLYYNFKNKNYFGNKKKLTNSWYTGKLGILPVDDAIKVGFDTGYLHHILRLMIVGNFMNLNRIHPWEGLKWFMEFSCDSYEWVMYQNVLDMVFFVSGGETMRRPYISSSNYILKMSNYKKDDWSVKWNKLYYSFVKKNKKKLMKYKYFFGNIFKKI